MAKYTGVADKDSENIKVITPQIEELTKYLNESKREKEKKENLQEMKKLVLGLDEVR